MTNDEKLDLILEKLDEHSRKFEKIDQKLDEHSRKFEKIDQKLDEHSQKFEMIDQKLDEHSQKFEKIDQKLDEHSQKFEMIDRKLDDHQLMLSALIHGQEELKVNLDGFKLEVAKQFQTVTEDHKNAENSVELVEKRVWTTEKDVHRLKKLVGIE